MIRHTLLLTCSILFTCFVFAQNNIPVAATAPNTATAKRVPDANIFEPSKYYLRTLTPVMPATDINRVTINAWADSVSITTQYFDLLSRPLETVVKQASPSKKDYVSHSLLDEFGRVSFSYLPFVQQTANTNDGKFKTDAFLNDSAFYKAIYPNEQINYSQTTYDITPLERVVKQTAPGNSWTGAAVGISSSWRANTLADSVRLWSIAITSEDDIPATTAIYQAGSLAVQETIDEKGIKTISYTDEVGRTILTKQQVAALPATGHAGWLCTYYVYDEMNNLRTLIPPKATDALNTTTVNWNLAGNPAIKTGLCYSYYYDARGRVTAKQIPGKGKNFIAYDLLDRVVMVQDENLKLTNRWSFVKYDGQSRPLKSGVITIAIVKDSVIAQAARNTDYPVLTGTYTVMTETYYDDYTWITGGAPNSTLVTTNITSTNFNTSYNTYPEYAQPIAVSNRIRGSVTGIKKIVLNTATYLYTVPLYDDYGRLIQLKETNYTGGTDVLTKQYSFTGTVLSTHLQHQKAGINAQNHTLRTKYTYDHAGRLKTIIKNIDGLGDKTISQHAYNELGQLQTKTLGATLETQNFTYNIRGWLTGINKDYVAAAAPPSGAGGPYFGEALFYDYGFTANQFNGAIAGAKWKARGDGIARAYGFAYDNANRLTKADFSQQNEGATAWTNDKADFTANGLSYDAGSNILTMKQRGLQIGKSTTIDSLSYTYFTSSNQLQKVSDGITDPSPMGDFKDSSLTGDDYTYDVNGNTSKDNNRHLHTATNGPGAVYNLLDKPDSLAIKGKATLYYYYDAAGSKLRKQINDYSTGTTIIKNYLYVNGFVYLNDTLQYVAQEEGRIRYAKKRSYSTGTVYYAFEYDYFLRDHLGNVRTVITEGKDTATYMATMETADSATVRALFSNVYDPVRTVLAKPAAFDANSGNQFVARLNASSGINLKTGPSLVLKVMAGDKVQINTFAYYNTPVQPPVTDNILLTDLLSTLVGGVTAQSGGKIISSNAGALNTALNPNVLSFLNNRSYNSTIPKAYLNWVLLDNQFNYVSSNMGAMQVLAGSSKQPLVAPLQTMAKNGYLYVFVSNQSTQDVYFDDLTVTHTTGPLLQEQSYYPFGLQMSGISDKALNKLNTQAKFNGGVDLEDETGYYNTFYRQYDAQIGRFTGVDMYAEAYAGINPYQFAANNPVLFNDPMGDQLLQGGRSQKGPDGNYHVGWASEMMWNNFGFFDWGNGGGGGSASGNYSNIQGLSSASVLSQMGFGDKLGTNKAGEYGFWASKWVDGAAGNGSTLSEVKGTTTFTAFTNFLSNAYFGYIDPAMVWINQNVNPVTPFAELVMGRAYSQQGFVEPKPRLQSGSQAVIAVIPFGRIVGAGERILANQSANLVYQGFNRSTGAIEYVGITGRDAAVRFGEHWASGTEKSLLDFRVVEGATNLSRLDARIWEQNLINQYGLPNLLNVRNSISPVFWPLFGIK